MGSEHGLLESHDFSAVLMEGKGSAAGWEAGEAAERSAKGVSEAVG